MLIIGAGALGSANAEMFVRAGVGTVTIVDGIMSIGVIYKGSNCMQRVM